MKKYEQQAAMMERHGGSFAKSISVAYGRADSINSQILETAFTHLFESYNHFLR